MAVPIMGHYEKAWQAVVDRVAAAATACGRPPDSVRLLAVSKTFPAEAVRAVYAAGQRAFGENYVQEAAAKRAALADLTDVSWHLIGPLQSNKTAQAAAFDWVESVVRLKIAPRLGAQRPPGVAPVFSMRGGGERARGRKGQVTKDSYKSSVGLAAPPPRGRTVAAPEMSSFSSR